MLTQVLILVGGTTLARTAGSIANNSRGLVGDTHFAILPNITPSHTFILTLLVQAVRVVFKDQAFLSDRRAISLS